MEAKAVDLDELQSQIAAAESYLLESSRPTSRTHAEIVRESHDNFFKDDVHTVQNKQGLDTDYREPERSSQTFEPSLSASLDRSISDREALVERLLMEHNRRKSLRVTSIDFGSVTASAEGIAEPVETSTSYFDNESIQDSLDNNNNNNSINYASTVKFTRSLHAWEREESPRNTVLVSQQHLPTSSKTENPSQQPSKPHQSHQVAGRARYDRARSVSVSQSRSRSHSRQPPQPETETETETLVEQTLRASSTTHTQPYSRRNSREMLLQAAEKDFQQKHPFHPTTKPNKQPRFPQENIVDRLYSLHAKQNREKELQRHAFDQLDMLECTFNPSISTRSKTFSHFSKNSQNSQISPEVSKSRLFDDAQVRMQKLHVLSEEITQAKMSEYTFTPTLLTTQKTRSFDVDDRPIHERLVDIQKERQLRLQQLQTTFENEKNSIFTFHPTLIPRQTTPHEISPNNESEVEMSEFDKSDVASRLLSQGKKLAQKKQRLLQAHDDYLSTIMTPVTMSEGSRRLAKRSPSLKMDFQSRQEQHTHRTKQHLIAQQQALDEHENTLFKPTIDSQTYLILENSRPDLKNETASERFHRLAVEDREKNINEKKHLEREIYGNLGFTPRIDTVSKLFGRKSTLDDLHLNPRGKIAHTIAKIEAEKEINENCTFQPKINETSRRIIEGNVEDFRGNFAGNCADLYPIGYSQQSQQQNESRLRRINLREPEKMLVEIRNHAMEQEQHRREVLIAREIAELQECTFTPSLPPSRSKEDPAAEEGEPIVIRGLGRHLELKQMANHKQQEKVKREHEAFHVVKVDHFRRPEDGSTIVQPFVLSTAARAAQQEQQARQNREKRLKHQQQQRAHEIYH